MSYFRTKRNCELSTVEYIRTQVNLTWSGVTVVKSFKEAYSNTIALPVICVRMTDTVTVRREVGSNLLDSTYNLIVDIFAKSDGQRMDLADFLLDTLKDGWTYNVYAHVSGDSTSIEGTDSGRVTLTSFIEDRKIDLGDNVDVRDKHRHLLSFSVRVGLS